MSGQDLLTPQETSAIAGVPLKQVYKVARERLPRRLVVRRGKKMFFRSNAAVYVRIDCALPKDVPVKVRKALYAAMGRDPDKKAIKHQQGLLSYVLDTSAIAAEVTTELAAYRSAMALIVEDPEVQGGAATFKGTRILVHTIAELLKAGAPAEELKEDYPRLADPMIAAALVYVRTHPRRGRPKTPPWRAAA